MTIVTMMMTWFNTGNSIVNNILPFSIIYGSTKPARFFEEKIHTTNDHFPILLAPKIGLRNGTLVWSRQMMITRMMMSRLPRNSRSLRRKMIPYQDQFLCQVTHQYPTPITRFRNNRAQVNFPFCIPIVSRCYSRFLFYFS